MLTILVQSVLFLIVACYAVYALLESRMVFLSGRTEKIRLTGMDTPGEPPLPEDLPPVSILLPIYNENEVVRRLLEAVCALDYPVGKLEILVLDDSTDATSALLQAGVEAHAARGVNIRLLRRGSRVGYKAGNLIHGMKEAKGDFLAIFDADCIPPRDFLLKTMPCFEDSRIGFLQTGISYSNRDASFLTLFQAMEAGHQQFVTVGLCSDGRMASLSGNSCVWRGACIEDIGGISAETITEDVDMGYRAQLNAWKYVFLRDVVSETELPESMSAFRVQRERWARGLIHNAARHVRAMFAVPMPAAGRMYAVSMMFSSLLLASFYLLILLALPLTFVTQQLGGFFNISCVLFLITAVAWACANFAGSRRGAFYEDREPVMKLLPRAFAYVAMFLPISLYYFCAAVRVLSGLKGEFNRTPKGKNAAREKYPPINSVLLRLELLTAAYAVVTLLCSVFMRNYWVCLFSGVTCAGFAMILFFSWREKVGKTAGETMGGTAMTVEHVLITGAAGAIGGALALEYAQPGRVLTLHGRRADTLDRVAEQCRAKGACVDVRALDLRDRQALRLWLKGVCADSVPDLLIVNAGLNTHIGTENEGERPEDTEALVEVNLLAAMTAADSVLPYMRKRGSGQIALISSLAAYFGLPVTPTYCATKAALKTYGEALRGWLEPEGIRINVVMPGYVASPMCDAMPGPKPFLWPPQRAARTIREGLERDRARISFPFPLNIGCWSLSVLPARLAALIVCRCGYGPRAGYEGGRREEHES